MNPARTGAVTTWRRAGKIKNLMDDPHLPTLVSSLEKSQARRLHAAAAALSVYHYERLAHTDAANLPPVNRPAIKDRRTLRGTLWHWLRLVF